MGYFALKYDTLPLDFSSISMKNIELCYLFHHFEKSACPSKLLFHFQSLLVSNVVLDRRLSLTFLLIRREQPLSLTTKICFKMNKSSAWSVSSHTLLIPCSFVQIPSRFYLLENLFANTQHVILMFPGVSMVF